MKKRILQLAILLLPLTTLAQYAWQYDGNRNVIGVKYHL